MNWKSKSTSEVAKEEIWKEYVRHEAHHMCIFETFRKNALQMGRNRPVAEAIGARPARFLDRQTAFLETIERRVAAAQRASESPDRATTDEGATPSPAPESPAATRGGLKLQPLGASPRPSRIDEHSPARDFVTSWRRNQLPPNRKQLQPLTETQAATWLTEPVSPPNFCFNRTSCEMTRFATALSVARQRGT